jgi:hypothetical protein
LRLLSDMLLCVSVSVPLNHSHAHSGERCCDVPSRLLWTPGADGCHPKQPHTQTKAERPLRPSHASPSLVLPAPAVCLSVLAASAAATVWLKSRPCGHRS